jgi:hypothetical protein
MGRGGAGPASPGWAEGYPTHEDPGAGLEATLRQQGVDPPPPVPLGTGRGARTYNTRVR